MNIEPHDQDGDGPPPWFTNEEDAAEHPPPANFWRILFGIGIAVVVLIMLLIPVLQAEVLQRRRESLPDEEVARTALLFSSAMLFGRSEGQALLFTADEGRDDVLRVLGELFDRSLPSSDARLQVLIAPCNVEPADVCYQGRIIDPSNLLSSAIRFGIDDTDDGPKIVWVEFDVLTAFAPRYRLWLTIL